MFLKKLIIGLLSFYVFDPKSAPHVQKLINSIEYVIEREIEIVKKRRKEKKQSQKYDNRKYKKKHVYQKINFKISGTRAKDVRYSNQQKLRRMYRNG